MRLASPLIAFGAALAAGAALAIAVPAKAALPVGAKAPDFRTTGALAGKPFTVHLAQKLRQGPVVLYFYPKAFTQGCTLEAKAFSDAMPEFRKLGATVVGMSADDLATLKKFSVEACRGQFPVATASPAVIKALDRLGVDDDHRRLELRPGLDRHPGCGLRCAVDVKVRASVQVHLHAVGADWRTVELPGGGGAGVLQQGADTG